jgi:CRP-like cAMP-binding protein
MVGTLNFGQEDGMADEGLRDRLTRQGEDALGKLAQDLLENPLVNGAISRAFEARERASQAQEAALGAFNIPSAADVERLTRRLRSVSQRLEGIEDGVDRLDGRLAALKDDSGVGERLAAIEAQLTKLAADVALLTGALGSAPAPVPREQERLEVDDKAPATKARRPRTKKSA